MFAHTLLEEVHAAGGSLTRCGDRLRVTAPVPLSDDLVDRLRRHMPDMLRLLCGPADPEAADERAASAIGPREMGMPGTFTPCAPHPDADERGPIAGPSSRAVEFPIILNDRWRVADDPLQWILEVRRGQAGNKATWV